MGVMRVLQSPLRRTSDARAAAALRPKKSQNQNRFQGGYGGYLDDEITESGRRIGREQHYTN